MTRTSGKPDTRGSQQRLSGHALAREIGISVTGSIVAPILLTIGSAVTPLQAVAAGVVIGLVLAVVVTLRELANRTRQAADAATAAGRQAARAQEAISQLQREIAILRAASTPFWLHEAIRHAEQHGIEIDVGTKAIGFRGHGRPSCVVELPLPDGLGGDLEQRRVYNYLGLNPNGLARVA